MSESLNKANNLYVLLKSSARILLKKMLYDSKMMKKERQF